MKYNDIKVDIWKSTGKLYKFERTKTDDLEKVEEEFKGRYKGMTATIKYWDSVDTYVPYQMFKL